VNRQETAELIGENIKAARKAKGWSQQTLSEMAGIAPPTLNSYESGNRLAPVFRLLDLARVLDVSIVHLMGGGGTPEYEAGYRDGWSDHQRRIAAFNDATRGAPDEEAEAGEEFTAEYEAAHGPISSDALDDARTALGLDTDAADDDDRGWHVVAA
jgi:transcriptional regulator with XRE-family HTH domain